MFAHLPVFKKAYISCLRLHPENVNWLFCGADHGKIALIDTGLSGSTDYKIAWQKIKMVSDNEPILFYYHSYRNCNCNKCRAHCFKHLPILNSTR